MHHADGGSGKIFQQKIPIGHAVQAVLRNLRKAKQLRHPLPVEGICGAGQRAGTQRHHIRGAIGRLKPRAVTQEHLEVSHHMVGQGNGLRLLQVRVAGHDGMQVVLGNVQQGLQQVG